MSELVISNLVASIPGRQILHGINLQIRPGEVHAVMGPNGAGKSTLAGVLMGRPGYEQISGSVALDGNELLGLATWERAVAGLHLVMQYPIEVPGVALIDAMTDALAARGRSPEGLRSQLEAEADRIGFGHEFLDRPLNVDLSGGEKKRNETLQLAVLAPKFVVLDELDSGLDVDALRACGRRVADLASEQNIGVLAITHYHRLLDDLRPDFVHVLARGRIVASGGPDLAHELEKDGYGAYVPDVVEAPSTAADPFADPFS